MRVMFPRRLEPMEQVKNYSLDDVVVDAVLICTKNDYIMVDLAVIGPSIPRVQALLEQLIFI
jgi:hypothetical protein